MEPEQRLAALVVELEQRTRAAAEARKAEKEEVDLLKQAISRLAGEIESGQASLLEDEP